MDIDRIDIVEVYSPPRVSNLARDYTLSTCDALDLQTGWDRSKPEVRKKAWEQIKKEEPKLIISRPPCKAFSPLQQMKKDKLAGCRYVGKERDLIWREVVCHVKLCIQLYKYQLQQGRHFLHEHPTTAGSWQLASMQTLQNDRRVYQVKVDLCMFGLLTHDVKRHPARAKKPTTFLTSSWGIADEMNVKCDKSHHHQTLTGGRAGHAAVYPNKLYRSICRGLTKQLDIEEANMAPTKRINVKELSNVVRKSGMKKELSTKDTGTKHHWRGEVREEDGAPQQANNSKKYTQELNTAMNVSSGSGGQATAWDDVSGAQLDPKQVRNYRKTEMELFKSMKAYNRCKRSCIEAEGGKLIDAKWIDIDKGDAAHPICRSRLVGR